MAARQMVKRLIAPRQGWLPSSAGRMPLAFDHRHRLEFAHFKVSRDRGRTAGLMARFATGPRRRYSGDSASHWQVAGTTPQMTISPGAGSGCKRLKLRKDFYPGASFFTAARQFNGSFAFQAWATLPIPFTGRDDLAEPAVILRLRNALNSGGGVQVRGIRRFVSWSVKVTMPWSSSRAPAPSLVGISYLPRSSQRQYPARRHRIPDGVQWGALRVAGRSGQGRCQPEGFCSDRQRAVYHLTPAGVGRDPGNRSAQPGEGGHLAEQKGAGRAGGETSRVSRNGGVVHADHRCWRLTPLPSGHTGAAFPRCGRWDVSTTIASRLQGV